MVDLEVVNDLWLQIDKIHLSCLQTEESPQKIDQVRKLKGKSMFKYFVLFNYDNLYLYLLC